jgi:hypothetical protein
MLRTIAQKINARVLTAHPVNVYCSKSHAIGARFKLLDDGKNGIIDTETQEKLVMSTCTLEDLRIANEVYYLKLHQETLISSRKDDLLQIARSQYVGLRLAIATYVLFIVWFYNSLFSPPHKR